MTQMKKWLSVLLCALICLAALPALAEEGGLPMGEPLADFSVTTITGETFTLSEALSEKGLVLINLWASWCGPCEYEFPFLEEAWEEYQDKVAVIALSTEPEDSDEVLTGYAESHGLTFPIANEGDLGLSDVFVQEGIPTTLVVDKFGNVAFLEVGSQSSAGAFTRVFDYFLSEDYTETAILDGVPPMAPTVPNPTDEELSAALNVEGGELVFTSAGDEYTWPWVPAEKEGFSGLANSNAGVPGTEATVLTTVTAQEGDALVFNYAASTMPVLNMLYIYVDGEQVKALGGARDWNTWAIPLTAGEHEIAFTYMPYDPPEEDEDTVWLDNVQVLSGEAADMALSAMPVWPGAGEAALTLLNEDAKEIVFDDPDGMLEMYFGARSFYIVPSGEATVTATIPEDYDPDAAFFYCYTDVNPSALSDNIVDGAYTYTGLIDSMETTGYSYGGIFLYSSINYTGDGDVLGVLLFVDEENVNTFVQEEEEYDGLTLSWTYADGTAPGTDALATGEAPYATYVVKFVDQDGEPVPGCVINFCTDETCVPTFADEEGIAVFEGMPYAYHLQVIKVPEGYSFDTAYEFYVDEEAGGTMTVTVQKVGE